MFLSVLRGLFLLYLPYENGQNKLKTAVNDGLALVGELVIKIHCSKSTNAKTKHVYSCLRMNGNDWNFYHDQCDARNGKSYMVDECYSQSDLRSSTELIKKKYAKKNTNSHHLHMNQFQRIEIEDHYIVLGQPGELFNTFDCWKWQRCNHCASYIPSFAKY